MGCVTENPVFPAITPPRFNGVYFAEQQNGKLFFRFSKEGGVLHFWTLEEPPNLEQKITKNTPFVDQGTYTLEAEGKLSFRVISDNQVLLYSGTFSHNMMSLDLYNETLGGNDRVEMQFEPF